MIGLEEEWGYFLLSEIEGSRGPLGLPVERDLCFSRARFSKCFEGERFAREVPLIDNKMTGATAFTRTTKKNKKRKKKKTGREEEMAGEKVQFQTNVPVEVALKYNDGKEVTGQFGDQVLYTLTDGRVMYVPPIVKKKIEEAGIARGELFTITKAERKNGTRRTIEWVIATDGGAAPGRVPDAGRASGARQPSPSNGTPAPATRQTVQTNRRVMQPVDPKGFLATGPGQSLLQAFSAAIDLAASIERCASTCGVPLQFTSADVREIGLSIYGAGK